MAHGVRHSLLHGDVHGVKHNAGIFGGTTTLTMTLTDATDPIIGGNNEVYTCQVNNTGGVTATSVSVTITLDASLAYVSSSGTGWSISRVGQVVTCTLASLNVGAANPITVTATTANSTAAITTTAACTCANATTVNASQGTQVNGVSKDATSSKYVPASSTEWGYLGLTAPNSLWLCQEASGNLADSIGSITLTQNGTGHQYQQAVTGWTRKAVKTVDATANQYWGNSTTAPNSGTTSIAMLAYWVSPGAAPAANRTFLVAGSTVEARLVTTGKIRGQDQANFIDSSGTYVDGAVHPVLIVFDRTNSKYSVYTENQAWTVTYDGTATGINTRLGAGGATPPSAGYLYAAQWSGANAEALSTVANARTLLSTLGWTVGF